MNFAKLFAKALAVAATIQKEVGFYEQAVDKDGHVEDRAEQIFDRYLKPIDLPINDKIEDAIVDPGFRVVFSRSIVGIHTAILGLWSVGDALVAARAASKPKTPAPPVEGED